MPRVYCPICFKLYNDTGLSQHIKRIHKDEVAAGRSADDFKDNISSEIMQDSEDQSGYHDDEWDDMGESMQEIEISEDVIPNAFEVTAFNNDDPLPAENFNSTGGNIQYSTEEDTILYHHDERNIIPRNTISYQNAGILPSQLL
jgi:hypothetical protein